MTKREYKVTKKKKERKLQYVKSQVCNSIAGMILLQ